jgi:hypothetical protein
MTAEQAHFFPGAVRLGQKYVQRRGLVFSTVDYSASATLPAGSEWQTTTSLGVQYSRREAETAWAEGYEFPAVGLGLVDATAFTFGGEEFGDNATVGLYVQEELALRNRLFLTAAVRADDNSAFGEAFDFVAYPKLSAAWVLSEEPFFESAVVNSLRVRAAWGASGQQPDSFASLRTFAPQTGGDGDGIVVPDQVGNPDLKPERGEELELGVETSLLDGRLAIDLTAYRQRTRDAILLRGVAPSSGFSGSQYVNAGAIRNQGIELAAHGRLVEREQFAWDADLNVAYNHNEVLDTGDDEFITASAMPLQLHQEGYPIGALFDRRIVSATLGGSGQAVDVSCDDGAGGSVACDDAPFVYLGRALPTVEWGLSSTIVLFDRVRLHAVVDGRAGHKKMNFTYWHQCSAQSVCEAAVDPAGFDPILVAGIQRRDVAYSIQDASFVKLREISVSYTLPDAWAGRIGASLLSVSLAGQNLHTWTSYPGIDPEGTQTFTDQFLMETANTPQTARFISTLRVSF